MEIFQKYILWIHIFAGGIALIMGLVPMVTEKGANLHKQSGRIYFWAMFIIFITALLRFRPEMRMVFLDCIAIFSFYNTFTGRRLVQMKDIGEVKTIDWIALYTAMIFGAIMIGIAIWALVNNVVFLWATLGFFGWRCLRLAVIDWQIFKGKKQTENLHWFYNHIARMIGSYIATLTAFLVVNNKGFVPDLIAWISPAVIGIFAIVRLQMYYRSKFKQSTITK
jgi:uncharacterized membrane protein